MSVQLKVAWKRGGICHRGEIHYFDSRMERSLQKFIGLVLLALAWICPAGAQMVYIEEVSLHGNKWTRDRIVYRELDFAVGDSIPIQELAQKIEHNRNQLLNLGLFNEVEITVREWDVEAERVHIWITMQEAWRIYLIPIIELADRNFNVWWEEYNRSFNRLNLGLRVRHINLTGNNDKFKLAGQIGFTPKFELNYDLPFFNAKQTLGLSLNVFHAINKEVGYTTAENKILFVRDKDRVLLTRNRARVDISYRPDLYWSQNFKLEWQYNEVDDLIGKELNPDYFLDGRLNQRFFLFEYAVKYDKRNIKIYPTSGFYGEFKALKRGLGIYDNVNALELYPAVEKHFQLQYRWSVGFLARAKWSLIREKQSYAQNMGLGYGVDFLRGYELFVIDGMDFAYMKITAKFLVTEKLLDWGRWVPLEPFRHMPWRLYLSADADLGYVNDPFYSTNNDFTNRWLVGWGPSATLVLYNNFALHFQYSINHLGEKGLFLHNKLSF